MKRRILVVTTLMLASVSAFAQQDYALTHFIYNKMAVNPGESGIEDGMCGNAIYRNQWDKVNGAPNTLLVNGEINLSRWLEGGAGININHDAIGFNRQTSVILNFSKHFNVRGGKLGIGVGVGLQSFGLNPTWVPPSTLSDGSLPAGSSAMTLDANFGIYYRHNDWYAGVSATHLPASTSKLTSSYVVPNGTGNVDYNAARHYYYMGGYTFRNIGPGEIDVQMLGQTDFVKMSVNLNARYIYNGFVYGGLAFRNSDAVSLLAGFRFLSRTTKAGSSFAWGGYSYDLTIGKISNISNGTHEIALKYCFIPKIPITKTKHPRWL